MSNRVIALAVLSLAAAPSLSHAQATPTASRAGDLQVGGGFVIGNSDYITPKIRGLMFYADFDPREHLGIEFEIHQANSPNADKTYERTYEIGGRYLYTFGRFVPYGKVMIGRGVFNFPGQYNPANNSYGQPVANLAYNMYALGAGVDFKATRAIHVRADYEYQGWQGFQPNGLNPQLYTIGVAYHFNGDLKGGR